MNPFVTLTTLTLALALCSCAAETGNAMSDPPGIYLTPDRPCFVVGKRDLPQLIAEYSESPLRDDYPDSWDIRNISSVNYASYDRNQHIPQYCGSCWGHAAVSSLADRFNLAAKDNWPRVNLAVQELINCGGGGSCEGGSAGFAYSYIESEGIADETCNPYQARDMPDCNPKCRTCSPQNCTEIKGEKRFTIEKHGLVMGEHAMMKQIYEHGPIACTMSVTSKFEKYRGGVFKQVAIPLPNHVVSIAGWGVTEEGEKFWIGRNSWGPWGENGWFRIIRGNILESLGIEDDCNYAIPSLK